MSIERIRPAGIAGVVYPAGIHSAGEPSHPLEVSDVADSAGAGVPAGVPTVAKKGAEIPKDLRETLKNTIWLTEEDEILNFHNDDGSVTHLVIRKDGTAYFGKSAGLHKAFSEAKARLATKSGRVGIVLGKSGQIKTVVMGVKHRGE